MSDTHEKTPLSPPNDAVEDSEDVLPPPVKFEVGEEVENIPSDKLNVVLLVMMLHGLGVLIAWNVFITIAPSVL